MAKINSVCIITNLFPGFPNATSGMFLYNLVESFVRLGVSCTVIRPVSLSKAWVKGLSCPPRKTIHHFDGGEIMMYSPRYVSFGDRTAFWLERSYRAKERAVVREFRRIGGEFDAVYAQFFTSGRTAWKIHKLFGIPFFTAHGESDFTSQFDRFNTDMIVDFYAHSTGIIAVSSPIKQFIIDRFTDADEKITVEPNGTNTSLFKPMDKQTAREMLGIPKDEIVALFVGTMVERKGARRLAQAVEGLEHIHAYVIGKGKEAVPRETENVHVCGEKKQSEIVAFLNAADMFVLPTLAEGSCNAIVEALACGLPVISSDRDFNRDMLDDRCAILIDPLDIGQIREAILTLANNRDLRERLSQGALEKARTLDIMERAKRILAFMEDRA